MLKDKNKRTLNLFPLNRKPHSEKVTLNDLWNGDEIPYALKSSLAFIYCYHVRTVNIFRRNGNEIAHESLFNCLKKNKDCQPLLSLSMIYDVCSAIKAYVRDIPNGLMVKKLLKEWHKIAHLPNKDQILLKMKSIVQKLPTANRNLLFHFLVLSTAIIENQKENSMSSKSLSIVLLPCFFEKVLNFTNMKDLTKFVDLLDIMILNAKSLVEADLFASIQKVFVEIGSSLAIQSAHNDDRKSLDDNKRSQFASQDSGLNSTSFLDDKSSSSQVRANYTENGMSMEDLLNDSDLINVTTTSDLSEENQLNRSNSIHSISSSISSNSNVSSYYGKHECQHRSNELKSFGHFSCIGKQVHSIKECRPSSAYDYELSSQNIWDIAAHSNHNYIPVYDRSGLDFDCKQNCLHDIQKDCTISPPQKSSNGLQRRKPMIKRSTCIIAPLQRRDTSTLHSSSSTVTIAPTNVPVTQISRNDSLVTSIPSSHSSINSEVFTPHIPSKYKPKRILNSVRSRFTVPIRPVNIEDEDWFPDCILRETEVNSRFDQNEELNDIPPHR